MDAINDDSFPEKDAFCGISSCDHDPAFHIDNNHV